MIDTLKASDKNQLITGDELRQRIQRRLTYTGAATLLGLTRAGLNHQMRGLRQVSRQTEIILDLLERGAGGELGGSAGAQALCPAG